jgi:hypothetical protein
MSRFSVFTRHLLGDFLLTFDFAIHSLVVMPLMPLVEPGGKSVAMRLLVSFAVRPPVPTDADAAPSLFTSDQADNITIS